MSAWQVQVLWAMPMQGHAMREQQAMCCVVLRSSQACQDDDSDMSGMLLARRR